MAPLLGTAIPLSHKTELLKDAFAHLADQTAPGLTQATGPASGNSDAMTVEIVVGYNIDSVEAKEVKERYINKLKMIANICDSIMELEMYRRVSSYFARIRDIILTIEKTINFYSSAIKKNIQSIYAVGEYSKLEKKVYD
jgi:hypothetical protein